MPMDPPKFVGRANITGCENAAMSRIFITGSSQGIGAECARQLIDQGNEVVLHGRTQARADSARSALPDAVGAAVGDLASISGAIAVAESALALGPFDVVIHNAGIGGGA